MTAMNCHSTRHRKPSRATKRTDVSALTKQAALLRAMRLFGRPNNPAGRSSANVFDLPFKALNACVPVYIPDMCLSEQSETGTYRTVSGRKPVILDFVSEPVETELLSILIRVFGADQGISRRIRPVNKPRQEEAHGGTVNEGG